MGVGELGVCVVGAGRAAVEKKLLRVLEELTRAFDGHASRRSAALKVSPR